MSESKKPSKPRSQVDAEERAKKSYVSPFARAKVQGPGEAASAANKNGYVGVDPIYQNAANDTDKPVKAGTGRRQASQSSGGNTGGTNSN